jgi:hypothetical protein
MVAIAGRTIGLEYRAEKIRELKEYLMKRSLCGPGILASRREGGLAQAWTGHRNETRQHGERG